MVAIAQVISKDSGVSLSKLNGVKFEPIKKFTIFSSMGMGLFAFFFFLLWNFPWPIFIGLPFTLLFGLAMAQSSSSADFIVGAGYVGSMVLRYLYWSKQPADTRGAFWKVLVFGVFN